MSSKDQRTIQIRSTIVNYRAFRVTFKDPTPVGLSDQDKLSSDSPITADETGTLVEKLKVLTETLTYVSVYT